MIYRSLAGAFAALAIAAPTAFAQTAVPLAGKGENIQPIARVPIPRINEVELAGNWAFLSADSGEDGEGGLYIVNIADPQHAFVEGRWKADEAGITDASYGDVDLSTDGNLAVLTNAHCSACGGGDTFAWDVLIDTTDKAHPKLIGKIPDDDTMDYVHTSTVDNKTLYLNNQAWLGYPQPGNSHVTAFDITDPSKPVKKGTIASPSSDLGFAHDTYIDHRPDGKTLMYAASIHKSDVMDITNPMSPTWLQTVTSEYTISHDVQPNFDRSVLIVDDEGVLGGQLDERISVCGKVGSGAASVDSGSVHFFAAAPDGTFANGGLIHLGTFNAPTNVNTGACVAHVFWQAPNENRLTQAYYRTGAFAVDFADPANPKMLGWFLADGGAEYWSNKPHRGYMFASDMTHGLDILKYTGEGGKRWPATAGPAEVQRSARQGVPYVPIQGVGTGPLPDIAAPAVPSRDLGTFSFTAKVKRVPGKKGSATLTLAFADAKGKSVGKQSVKRTAGKKATLKVMGVALAGRYSWTVKAAKKVLARGKFVVKRGAGLSLSPGAKLAATVK